MIPGMNPSMMKRLMKSMNMKPVSAKRVIIERGKGADLVVNNPEVTKMKAGGKQVLQVMGKLEELEQEGFPEEDVKMVVEQTGCSEEEAIQALGGADGDIAEAIMKLKK